MTIELMLPSEQVRPCVLKLHQAFIEKKNEIFRPAPFPMPTATHIGHVAGAYLPADIFVRWLKLHHEDVIYICGTDEHGTPISISADQKESAPPRW